MLFLIGSIVLSSYLTLAFKILERYRISLFQSIVFNYLTCVVTGSVMIGEFPYTAENLQSSWIGWALLMGTMFIIIFNIMGFTTQKISVAVSSVANKLSLVIPFLFSIFLYNEEATALKIAGIVVALVAVVLTCYPSRKEPVKQRSTAKSLLLVLPLVLFIGSGLLDTLIKYVQHHIITPATTNQFFIMGFSTAFSIGMIILLVQLLRKKTRLEPRAILAGILIGIPNYFSIWCLVKVLKEYGDNSSAIIPINNMGIVLFSAVMAWILFKEKLTGINWLGILLAVGAIALIAFG